MIRYPAAVIVLSDRAASGEREDACIPVVLESFGDVCDFVVQRIMPDEPADLQAALIDLADRERIALILTSGGTGIAPRDRTPQATAAILDYEIPGIPEAMRVASHAHVPSAMLSRAVAGVRGSTLIVNLPGSPKGVRETLAVLYPVIGHALELLAGRDSH